MENLPAILRCLLDEMREFRRKAVHDVATCLRNRLIPCQETFLESSLTLVHMGNEVADLAARVASDNHSILSCMLSGGPLVEHVIAVLLAKECSDVASEVIDFLAETVPTFQRTHQDVFYGTERAAFEEFYKVVGRLDRCARLAHMEACAHNELHLNVLRRTIRKHLLGGVC